jgi:nucleoside-diphosphate-sugar epimerase
MARCWLYCWSVHTFILLFVDAIIDSRRPQHAGVFADAALTSVVTGANGYVGRAVVQELIASGSCGDSVLCLVRPHRVASERAFWSDRCPPSSSSPRVSVLPYDMLDGGASLQQALRTVEAGEAKCVYHVASVFGPTQDHRRTALDNVRGTVDLVRTLSRVGNCGLILTSSMAAVRGTGQEPRNGGHYTHEDWNTVSELGANWGASYQWSKAEAERRAWQLSDQLGNVPMVALCPSFVFGPVLGDSSSYSIALVRQWLLGESQVQSRLFVDVRDAARAHVRAALATGDSAIGKRYILSTDARVSSREVAAWLQDVCRETELANPERIHFDANFTGGAIAIGEREVAAQDRLQDELGITLRPVKDTIREMARILLEGGCKK